MIDFARSGHFERSKKFMPNELETYVDDWLFFMVKSSTLLYLNRTKYWTTIKCGESD